jgi:hypothetical protein
VDRDGGYNVYTSTDATLQGWSAGGSASRWGLSSSTYHSAGYSVTDSPAGVYHANENTWLASPTVDLSATTAPTLNFWRSTATEAFDICIVEVSANGGTTFTSVDQSNGYQGFVPVTVDLAPDKASTQVIVRFRLETDSSISADGCSYDDVVITE